MGRPRKNPVEEPVIEEGVEIATPTEEEVKESKKGVITLIAKGGVNGVPAGYTRTFTDKAEADAWAEVYC